MRAPRHLALRKETLAELHTAELAAVAGGPAAAGLNLDDPTGQFRICVSVFRDCNTYNCQTYGCPTSHCGL